MYKPEAEVLHFAIVGTRVFASFDDSCNHWFPIPIKILFLLHVLHAPNCNQIEFRVYANTAYYIIIATVFITY